jgi:hypothetical protein
MYEKNAMHEVHKVPTVINHAVQRLSFKNAKSKIKDKNCHK